MRDRVALAHYFLPTGLAVFFAGAALGAGFVAALALGATGAATTAGAALSAARWSRRALISAPSLSLRSVSLEMLALILAMAWAVLDTGDFLGAGFAAGLAAGFAAGFVALAFTLVAGEGAAFAVDFFAVAMMLISFFLEHVQVLHERRIVASLSGDGKLVEVCGLHTA
jgi:hypothetical protein